MAHTAQICCTFVGDVSRDSRLRRFLEAAAGIADTAAVTLAPATTEILPDEIFPKTQLYSMSQHTGLRRALPEFWRSGSRLTGRRRFDLYLAADLYSLPLAARLAKRDGATLIYDSRELYRSIAALDGRSLTQQFWNRLERRYARRARAIMTVNESIATMLREEYARVEVFPNYPVRRSVAESRVLREAIGVGDDTRILLSQGGVQKGRGAFACVDAIAHLDGAVLAFLGDGALKQDVLRHARDRSVGERVFMLPSVPAGELGSWTASADLGLCLIENLGQSYYLSLPNKLFEYLAAGLPVVGSDFPEIGRVLRDSGAGVAVDPSDSRAVADAVTHILSDSAYYAAMKQRGLAASERYNWDRHRERFQHFLLDMLSTSTKS